jgi:dUTP pyrophosphatase
MDYVTTTPVVRFLPLFGDTQLPERATPGSAGADLFAYLTREVIVNRAHVGIPVHEFVERRLDDSVYVVLRPGDKALIPLGFKAAIPDGYEAQIRPRSGLSLKTGLDIPNSPGTIDSDYREEWGVIVKNAGEQDITINHGDRIAQVVFARVGLVAFEEVSSLESTERSGGFGSTGV